VFQVAGGVLYREVYRPPRSKLEFVMGTWLLQLDPKADKALSFTRIR